MTIEEGFLSTKIADCDLILLTVLEEAGGQKFRGYVEHIYSSGMAIDVSCKHNEIEFIGGSSQWGNIALSAGDRALVFISRVGERLYEDHWNGHILLEQIDGEFIAFYDVGYAFHDRGSLLEDGLLPDKLVKCVLPNYSKMPLIAFQFRELEDYLIDSILSIRAQKASAMK